MKKLILLASILLSYTFVNAQKVNLEVVVQTQTNWCWAANSECILNYYSKPATQCDINDYAWSKSNCCSSPGSCNKTNQIVGKGSIEDIIKNFGDLESTGVQGGLSKDKLNEILTEGRPFVVGCMWSGGNGGHVVVGCGFNESANTITMMDPWQNNGMTTSAYSKSTVKLTTGSGNWKESLIVDTKPIMVGIEDQNNSTFNIFPSPGNGVYNIELGANANQASIEVYNVLGEVIFQDSWKLAQTGQIDISSAPKGNYIVSVKTGSKSFNKMIVKN